MRNEQLVSMVNAISEFFQSDNSEAEGAAQVAEHLRRYWDPRMRRQIADYVDQSGEGLTPLARAGVDLLAGKARIE